MTEDEAEQLQNYLEHKCAEIMEHVDSVQIVVTVHNKVDNSTSLISNGKGNIYSRIGACEDWINKQA